MCYITVFGPTHSGKSTLMGYIHTKDMSEIEYRQQVHKIRKEISNEGLTYYSDMELAYFVDTGKDERRKYVGEKVSSIGTSKRIHILDDLCADFSFIDTPGSDIVYSEQYSGQFMGDYGIYLIESTLLYNLRYMEHDSKEYHELQYRIFAPLFLWNIYKDIRNIVIVISKMDMINYDESIYAWICNHFLQIPCLNNVSILPISIDVYRKESENIYSKSELMNYYDGETLIEKLMQFGKEGDYKKTENLLAFIDRTFWERQVIRVKVLYGRIIKGDVVQIGPLKGDEKNIYVKHKIEKIKKDGVEVHNLDAGDIGTIHIPSYFQEQSKYTKKRTTIICGENDSVEKGNLLYITIDYNALKASERECIKLLKIADSIGIVWLGRSVNVTVVGIMRKGSICNLILFNQNTEPSSFIMPNSVKGGLLINKFALQLSNKHFISGKLTELTQLSDEHKVVFWYTKYADIDYEKLFYDEVVAEFNMEKGDNGDIISYRIDMSDFVQMLSRLRKFIKENGIVEYSLIIDR